MQRTEKYFEQNAYRREAVGHILAAEPDSRTGGGRIALDCNRVWVDEQEADLPTGAP